MLNEPGIQYDHQENGRGCWAATLCFHKDFWREHLFADMQLGSDVLFLRQDPEARIVALQAVNWLVDIIHDKNVSPKDSASPLWHPYSVEKLQELMGSDWAFYDQLAAK